MKVEKDKLAMIASKPRVVDVNPDFIGKILREEYDLEKAKYKRIIS